MGNGNSVHDDEPLFTKIGLTFSFWGILYRETVYPKHRFSILLQGTAIPPS